MPGLQVQHSTNPLYRKLLRKVRKQRGISARQLAKKIGVDPSYLSKIETGSVPPPAWDKMLAINSYTCVAEFTQYAAVEALKDREGATPRMVGEFARRREQFVRDLNVA